MIEVPITMALMVVAIMMGLGLFSFFVIARFVLKRLSGEADEKQLPKQAPGLDSSVKEPQAVPVAVPSPPVVPGLQPILMIGGTSMDEKRQVWRMEEPYRRLQRGLLSQADEAVLRECVVVLKTLLSIDEKQGEPVTAAPPPFLVMPASVPEPKPSRSVFDFLGREKVVVTKPVSMASQMNTILQDLLKSMPGEPINLRIEDGPQGDLRIWYQSKAYNGLEELPDANIQDLIRKAADAWLIKNANQR